MSDRIKDFALSIGEEGLTEISESNWIKEIIVDLLSEGLSESTSLLISSIFAAAAPRIGSAILSYKVRRLERNIQEMKKSFGSKIDSLESNYEKLCEEKKERYCGEYAEMLLDNIVDERQTDKIKWNVNGFVNLMADDSNESTMQLFFDTLAELTVLDVDVLEIYALDSEVDPYVIKDRYGIDNEQLKVVKEKLVRLGLLSRKNDELRDRNIDEVVEYLKKVEKDSKRNKPNGVKVPNSIKKVSGFESYRMTSLGRALLKTIEK